jgi:hypothetical protein
MIKVKVDDRAALECAYPPEAYAADSAENSAAANKAVSGVRILTAPDGEFSLERGRRQVGKAVSGVFIVPYRLDPAMRATRRRQPSSRAPATRLSSMRSSRRRGNLASIPRKPPAGGIRESAGCGSRAVGN